MKKENYVKVCPLCGSTNITHRIVGYGTTLVCKDCRYENTFFPEVEDSKVEEFKKNLKKK